MQGLRWDQNYDQEDKNVDQDVKNEDNVRYDKCKRGQCRDQDEGYAMQKGS